MKKVIKKLKGKKVLSLLLALIMVIAVASPAFSPIIAKAASTYPVELGFNNLFIFEEWASDKNSTTVVGANTDSTLVADVANGSFTITKKSATTGDYHQVYTGHGMDKTNAISNTDYYQMSVEPNTTYSLSYNLGGSVTPTEFFTTVFMFDNKNLCLTWVNDYANNAGDNSFVFTTPAGTNLLQIRFGIENSGTPNAKVNNISLTKCDVVTDSAANLFNFDSWANSSNGKTVGYSGMVYADGTVVPNTSSDTITMNLNANGSLFTGFSLDTTNGYYTIPVEPNSYYVLNYNLVNSLSTVFKQFTPYVVTISNNGAINYAELSSAIDYGQNSCVFVTGSDTAYIYPVFTMGGSSTNWTVAVKDIEILAAEVDDNKISPNRLVKTYGEDATYGSLPTVEAPANYIFAGWNTKADGTGMRIAADTPVQPMSLTVYPKFEPAVDSLEVTTQPTKTIYTVGEKLDATGLVLKATIKGKGDTDGDGATDPDTVFNISSGYYCTPEVLDTVGTQTITVNYGGKTATFTVTVKANEPGTVIINGGSKDVTIANNEYTLNYSASAFNRYEVIYKSDSYVSGVATFNDGKTEEFFLEPSDNGSFGSYIDGFLEENTYNQIVKIKFTILDKENGNFELVSLNTTKVADPGDTVYFENNRYEMGVSLKYGGVVSELYDLYNDVVARTYSTTFNGSTATQTRVDTKDMFNSGIYNSEGTYTGTQSEKVNLINTYDAGRYLQQSYYGTSDKPYVESEYNNADWPYNPVQGGNAVKETSKIIDYKVTDEYVYIKARPLDWAKWSDDYAENANREGYDAIWGDDYITDTYVEAWYYFQGDVIKVSNRKVDYSGLPEATHSQEYPALYLIEPLNHFVYNNVSAENAWKNDNCETQTNVDYVRPTDGSSTYWNIKDQMVSGRLMNIEEPEYWGLVEMYKDKFGITDYEPWVDANENWAAFTASEDPDSFGVGIYTDTTTKFYYGIQPEIYQQKAGTGEGSVGEVTNNPAYRHAQSITPASELATSYIAPTDSAVFKSYDPTEYTYYLTTGTVENIRDEFKAIHDNEAEKEASKPKIAVPETVYLDPANNTNGQYYVNNVMNHNNYYQIETTTDSDYMYMGFHAEGAKNFIVDLTNVDDPSNDPFVGLADNDGTKFDNMTFDFTDGTVEYNSRGLGLHLTNPLDPGEKNTIKWDITIIYEDGSQEVFTAYTVAYAPGRTVGAVAESRKIENSQNEISSWITGANGVDHSTWSPLGSLHGDYKVAGYFTQDPLVYENVTITGSGGTATDYIEEQIEGTQVDNNEYNDNTFVMQTATNGNDGSRAKSYLGLLKIDKSRYTKTSQIPNLEIGYDLLRKAGKDDSGSIGTLGKYDSLSAYRTYYTLGTVDSFTSTSLSDTPDSSWTQYPTTVTSDSTAPVRERVVPDFDVSGIDGKYIHALTFASSSQTYANLIPEYRYATAGTSVLCSVTDKDALRETVTEAYGVKNQNPEFLEKLEAAATILGDPSASQEDIDLTQKELDDALSQVVDTLYALKYDNLFSIYEFSQHSDNMKVTNNGTASYNNQTLTVVNGTITGGEAYTSYGSGNNYYKVALEPNTEYVFEYDVTTDVQSQAFMFFYNSSNSNSEKPTNMSVQVNGGAWTTKNENNSWWGYYGSAGTYHYVIKFTTGATTTQAGFRFGNTGNDPCTSTFSNIRLIDAERYYADVEYESVEELHVEYSAYGALPVLTRTGYTFNGWKDEAGNTVNGSNVATKHESIFSQWSVTNYTITYDANGGKASPTSQAYTVEDTLNIPTPTREGYSFQGWTVTVADGNWELNGMCSPGEVPARMYGNVTLTAQWVISEVNVTFDNLFDYSKFNIGGSLTVNERTGTGFTVTSTGGDANTGFSYDIPVEPGKTYIFSADITFEQVSGGYDMYVHTCDANRAGETSATPDTSNGAHREGDVYISLTGQTTNGTNYIRFTAGENTSYIRVRFDANAVGNKLTVRNIRIWEDDGVELDTANKVVSGGGEYGTLPEPTKTGYKFDGWMNAEGQWVNAEDIVTSDTTVNLYSQWTEKEYGVLFSTNGGSGEYSPLSVKYSDSFTLYDDLTTPGAEFLGWSTEQFSTTPDFEGGSEISIGQLEGVDLDYTENVTLYAVWKLTDDAVSDDVFVSDFGLAMTLNPFGNDTSIFGYHALGFSDNGYNIGFSTDNGNTIAKTAEGAYGNFSVDGLSVIYTPTKVALDVEEITFYTKITYRDGSVRLLSNTIEIAPASNVYYEEDFMAVKNATNTTTKMPWSDAGVAANTNGSSPENKVVVGFDNVYNVADEAYSNGKALTVTVDSTTRNSEIQTFDFVGTGIDVVSRCDVNTGVMLVNIKQEVDGKMKTVKAGMVDTYCEEGEFNQTPVFSWSGDYGKYTVEISAMYLTTAGALNAKAKAVNKSYFIDTGIEMNTATSFNTDVLQAMLDEAGVEDVSAEDVELIWFDDNSILNGGTGVAPSKKGSRADGGSVVALENYIDGFRIYNPLNKNDDYYADTETKASYANVIDNLAPVSSADGSVIDDLLGIAYITGFGDATSITFEQYKQSGPKGELYLNGGKAISFKINRGENERVMLGLRAAKGVTTINVNGYNIEINSATEMYYDISNCIGTGNVTVTINNTGDNLLAVNHIKFSGGSGSNGTVVTPRSMTRSADATEATTNKFLPVTQEDLVAIEESMSAEPIPTYVENGLVIPVVEDEEEIPDDTTNPDDDNINDDTNTDGGNTDADDETDSAFDIFSLLRMLIEFIKEILFNSVGNGSLM